MINETNLQEYAPRDELAILVREATRSVERDLALEDVGWINPSGVAGEVITAAEKIINIKLSRLYATLNPMGVQAIRLWNDYTFGTGMTWDTEEEKAKNVLTAFWDAPENQRILSSIGQRTSSRKLLTDGVIYFAIFLSPGGKALIRRIDPLEITDIITDPNDKEDERYYRRAWVDAQSQQKQAIYRSISNIKDEGVKDRQGADVKKTEDALVYRVEFQDGNPLLLPGLLWMKYLTLQLSSYIAVDIAQSKFVLRSKVIGGQTQVDAMKAVTDDQEVAAGSHLLENEGITTESFTIDKRAKNAYDGARLTRLQFCASVGIPEQYFGDLATGNLATAKTVELPMMKMFQSYQQLWTTVDRTVDSVVLTHAGVAPDKQYVDINFPAIAPEDVLQAATAMTQILGVFPEFASSQDVQQEAMLIMGINDPAEALEQITQEAKANPERALAKVLKELKESLKKE